MYRRHRSSHGAVPREIFLRKKEYVLSQSPCRPGQRFSDFSTAAQPFTNPTLKDKVYGDSAWFGPGGIEYVAFIGLRGDEQLRVAKVEARRANAHANPDYEGEHVYLPFPAMNVSKRDVNAFWERQSWGLQLPDDGALSNCVYCFLKGVGTLEQVRDTMQRGQNVDVPGFGSMVDTPCDVRWWTAMEQRYGRNLDAEKRVRTGADSSSFVGFFGASSGLSYQVLAESRRERTDLSRFANSCSHATAPTESHASSPHLSRLPGDDAAGPTRCRRDGPLLGYQVRQPPFRRTPLRLGRACCCYRGACGGRIAHRRG